MKDSFLFRYDPNTGANCFYTNDITAYTIGLATTQVNFKNFTQLFT